MDGNRFDEIARQMAAGASRRRVLQGLAGAAAGLAGTALGRAVATAAPGSCSQVCGKTAFFSGPEHAACLQACRRCEGDLTRVCQAFPTGAFVCCPPDTACLHNCQIGFDECCEPDPNCPDTCAGTCCI